MLFRSIFPVLISLGLEYSRLVESKAVPRTQILVHDTEILKQLEGDCRQLLGEDLSSKVEFFSVQALRNEKRRANLKYVIVDECHWGNATEEDTIQSSLIDEVKSAAKRCTLSNAHDGVAHAIDHILAGRW